MSKKDNPLVAQPSEQYPYEQLLDYGGKVVAMLSAGVSLAYAMGFVITNIHLLTKYGIYDFELIKTRYILTGFFFIILTYITFVISLGILKTTDEVEKKTSKIIVGFLGAVFFAGFIGTFIKGVISWVVGSYSELGIVSTFIRIWSLLAIISIIAIITFVRSGGWNKQGINIPIPFSIFTSALLLAGAYSQLVYPVLPIALGGGDPVPVQLIVEDEKVKFVSAAIPFADNRKTEMVYLIDQSSSSYFVLVPFSDKIHGQAVEIRKDYIVSVIHLTKASVPLLRINATINSASPTSVPTAQTTSTP
ncbi:MAG: hypothetical protein WHS87_11895 [Anaerolineales bacterium]